MACPTCGLSVLFGGVKDGDKKYCSKKCYEGDEINRVAKQIPLNEALEQTNRIRHGKCPLCQGNGPIDIHKSYSVYSIIFYTSYKTKEHIVCKDCAKKIQFKDLLSSSLLGWWGLPFGLIITPIQVTKNILALFSNPGQRKPTELLIQRSRQMLAAKQMQLAG
jgi:hypothetical protein